MLAQIPYLNVPLSYDQLANGQAKGVETVANWDVTSKWRLTSIYSYGALAVGNKPGNNSSLNVYQNAAGSLPRHQAQARSYWDLNKKLQLDTAVFFVDRLTAQALPSYTTVNVRLGWVPVPRLDISASVENLLNREHGERITSDDVLYVGKVFGRTADVKLTWRF